MATRAVWKGFLKLAELSSAVALHTAVSTSERVSFHTVNRATGNRVHRQFVDEETGKVVEREDQVKGYEAASGDFVVLEPDEVAAAVPESDKILTIDSFVACGEVDTLFLDRSYYITPDGPAAAEPYALFRDGLRKANVAALATTVLFRRVRTVLIYPHDDGLIGSTLEFSSQVRAEREAFDEIPDIRVEGEMLELAEHIIKTKRGSFDPKGFDDRYDAALTELVRAKLAGRAIRPVKREKPGRKLNLMEALRMSAEGAAGTPKRRAPRREAKSPPRKTGTRRKAG